MANKSVLAAIRGRLLREATDRNAEGAPGYAHDDAHRVFGRIATFAAGHNGPDFRVFEIARIKVRQRVRRNTRLPDPWN